MDLSRIDIIPVAVDGQMPETTADPLALSGASVTVIAFAVLTLLGVTIMESSNNRDTHRGGTEPFEYVEARLLKEGEVKDDTELPDRIVPPQPTVVEEVLPLDKNEDKPEPEPEPEPDPDPQPTAVEDDKLRQVFEKARAFAEIQDDYVPEGHPDGVPEGDVTDPELAAMGATYGRRITRYIQERWILPTLISDKERQTLSVKVNLRFNSQMTIIDYTVLQSSPNSLFDDSVILAIETVQKEIRNLPEPPQEIANRVFGGGITITLYGADAPIQ